MKKIIAILISFMLGATLLVGCGDNQKELDKQKDEIINQLKGSNGEVQKITEGTIYNTLAGVAPKSSAYYILNKDKKVNRDQSIVIELNIEKANKETEINEFMDKTIKITDYLKKDLTDMGYKSVIILMYVNEKFVGNSISFNETNNSLEHKDTKISEVYWDAFQKVKNNKKD